MRILIKDSALTRRDTLWQSIVLVCFHVNRVREKGTLRLFSYIFGKDVPTCTIFGRNLLQLYFSTTTFRRFTTPKLCETQQRQITAEQLAVKLHFSQDSKMFSNTDTTVSRIVLTVQMFKILYLKCASPDEITSGVHLVALNCRQALFRGRPLPS